MWWNFVGRSHEEIERFRQEWQDEGERFGRVEGYQGATQRLAAPELPHVRIRPRQNPRRRSSPPHDAVPGTGRRGRRRGRAAARGGGSSCTLDARAIVVRTGGQVVRYTVDRT